MNTQDDLPDDDLDMVGHEVLLHPVSYDVRQKIPPPVAPKPVLKQRCATAEGFDDDYTLNDMEAAEIDNAK